MTDNLYLTGLITDSSKKYEGIIIIIITMDNNNHHHYYNNDNMLNCYSAKPNEILFINGAITISKV